MMNLYLFANKNFCFGPVNFVTSLFIWQCTLMIGGMSVLSTLSLKTVCCNPPGSTVQDYVGQVFVLVAIPETPVGQK